MSDDHTDRTGEANASKALLARPGEAINAAQRVKHLRDDADNLRACAFGDERRAIKRRYLLDLAFLSLREAFAPLDGLLTPAGIVAFPRDAEADHCIRLQIGGRGQAYYDVSLTRRNRDGDIELSTPAVFCCGLENEPRTAAEALAHALDLIERAAP